MMTKAELKKIKGRLPRGYLKLIAERTGKSESSVYKTLSGLMHNTTILEEAISMAKEHTEHINKLKKQIKAI